MDKLHKLFIAHVEQLVEINTPVSVLTEGSLLFESSLLLLQAKKNAHITNQLSMLHISFHPTGFQGFLLRHSPMSPWWMSIKSKGRELRAAHAHKGNRHGNTTTHATRDSVHNYEPITCTTVRRGHSKVSSLAIRTGNIITTHCTSHILAMCVILINVFLTGGMIAHTGNTILDTCPHGCAVRACIGPGA